MLAQVSAALACCIAAAGGAPAPVFDTPVHQWDDGYGHTGAKSRPFVLHQVVSGPNYFMKHDSTCYFKCIRRYAQQQGYGYALDTSTSGKRFKMWEKAKFIAGTMQLLENDDWLVYVLKKWRGTATSAHLFGELPFSRCVAEHAPLYAICNQAKGTLTIISFRLTHLSHLARPSPLHLPLPPPPHKVR